MSPPPPAPRPTAPPPAAVMPRRGGSAPTPGTATYTGPVPTMQFQVAKPKLITARIVAYAPEKFGKTTIGAFAPDPIILQVRDTGYQTLLNAGVVPAVPAATPETWTDMMALLDVIAGNPQDRKTLVIDGMTGAERLCHEFVCETVYGGDWGEQGFMAYHKGYDLSIPEWLKFLAKLDAIQAKGLNIVLLGHARTKEVKNPVGANYDRFEPDVHAKTWGPTARWADAILFGKFHTIVEQAKREKNKSIAEAKGKAVGGIDRVIFTSPCDAWVAGNRFGMDSEIWLNGVGPDAMWSTIAAQIWRQNKEVAA